jgi:SPP1 family predicted phage head-tail adaptor
VSGERGPAIGTLTDRVQLMRRETARESEGGQSSVFLPLGTVWSRVRSLAGRQSFAADARGSEVSHSVVMRFRGDVRPGDRIVYRGRALSVVSAGDLNGQRAFLSCACSDRVVSG